MRDVKWIRAALLILAFFGSAYVVVISGLIRLPLGAPGTRDFSQYWGAWELLRHGMNPYDGALMRGVQEGLGGGGADTTWNPPWAPVLLAPVLLLPFDQASALWFLSQLGMVLCLALFIPRAINRPDTPMLLSGLITVSFLPVLDCLSWGQLSLLLTLGATMFMLFERNGMMRAAGVSLVPLTLKPHLLSYLLPALLVWWWRLSRKDRSRFALGFGGALSLLCIIVITVAPHGFAWWIASLMSPRAVVGAVPTVAWKTTTFSTWIRVILAESAGCVPVWPMIWLPLASLGAVTFFYARYRPIVRWETTFPTLVAIGLLTGAYGWLYDQSLLLVGLILVAGDAWNSEQRGACVGALGAVAAIEVLAITQSVAGLNQQHYFVWIPLAVLCVLGCCRRCSAGG
jgi:hypothetical protein